MTVLIIITLNICKYVRKTLYYKTLVYLYQKFLDYQNINNTVILIISFSFKDLKFLVLPKIDDVKTSKK